MTISQKYSGTTVIGCDSTLQAINGLDDNITIGELKSFLQVRKIKADNEIIEAQRKLIDEAVGKCFRLTYSKNHVVLLKIDSIEAKEQYGSVEGFITGETLTKHQGQIRHDEFSGNVLWSNYFPCKRKHEISLNKFADIICNFKSVEI